MKRKIGKIVVPLLALMLIAVAIVLYVIHGKAEARPVDDVRDRLGNYTGPINGTEQDDNIKASLDLLHDRLYDAYGGGSTDGDVFYVDSGVAGSAGTDWSTAVGTLNAAIALCGNNHGDVILVAPGHAENLSTADGVDVDIAGVTIIGMGNGDNRPTFTHTAAGGEFVIGADNVVVKNLQFIASVTGVVTAINVESGSTNYVIEDCFFDVDIDGTDEFIDCITIATASCDGGIIRNNFFDSGTVSNAGPQSWINIVDGNDIIIENNIMYGDCAVACIENETTAAYNLTIRNNSLFNGIIGGNAGLNAQPCIELVATTTGLIENNRLYCNVATPDDAIVAADCFISGNTYSESEGSAGGSSTIGTVGDGGIKCAEMTIASVATTTNLFQVTGGPIIIRDIVGVVTSNMAATTCLINYNIDPVEPATDTAFATDALALEINGDAAGTVYTWDGVIGTDLTATTNGVVLTQGHDVAAGLLCPIGMIELSATATNAGVIKFYLLYSPLSPLSVVTPQ